MWWGLFVCVHVCEDATCESKRLLHMRVNVILSTYVVLMVAS